MHRTPWTKIDRDPLGACYDFRHSSFHKQVLAWIFYHSFTLIFISCYYFIGFDNLLYMYMYVMLIKKEINNINNNNNYYYCTVWCQHQYYFCFSDFLKKILVDNPKRRLTIPLLKKEKWYTRYVIAAVNLPVTVFHSSLWLKGAISICSQII